MQHTFEVKASDSYSPGLPENRPDHWRYSLVEQIGNIDIRYYDERMAAQTPYGGPENLTSTHAAFERLSAYFQGENNLQRGLYETGATGRRGAAVPLQLPWTQQFTAKGWMMRFWLPRAHNFFTAPMPRDPEVSIVRLAPHAFATTRIVNGHSEGELRAAVTRIVGTLETTNWCAVGVPELWSYEMPVSTIHGDMEMAIEVACLSER